MNKYWKDIRELVSEETFGGKVASAFDLIDTRALDTLNALKEAYGLKMIINTWFMAGWDNFGADKFSLRGYRPADCPIGAPDSAHKRGMAFDIDFYGEEGRIPAKTIRKMIMNDIKKFPEIMCLETGIDWVHFDVMSEKDNVKRTGCNDKQLMLYGVDGSVSWMKRV